MLLCIGCGWNGSSDVWAGADALSFWARSRRCLQRCLGTLPSHWLRLELPQRCLELPQRLARSALVHAQQRCLHRHGLRLEWQQPCLGWRCRAQHVLCTLSAVLAAIRRHAAVALAAARMVAAMLGYAVSLGYYAQSMAMLVAVLRHAARASAAARVAAERCLDWLLGWC